MKRVFGAKKDKEPPPSIQDASDRITKRGDNVEEKIKKLDAELARYKEQIKKTRPGPAQEAVKARAMRVLKQKRMYEGQRDMLYNQTFNLDQASFAAEGIKDAQQTMGALKSANKELKGMMKTVNIQDIDNLQDEMMDLMDVSSEIQESLGRSYNLPEDIDEDELLGETVNAINVVHNCCPLGPVMQSLMHWKQTWGLRLKVGCLLIFNPIRNLTWKESSTCHRPQVGMLQFLLVEQMCRLRMNSGYQLFLEHISEVRQGVGVPMGGQL